MTKATQTQNNSVQAAITSAKRDLKASQYKAIKDCMSEDDLQGGERVFLGSYNPYFDLVGTK